MTAKRKRPHRKKDTSIHGLIRQLRDSDLFKEGHVAIQFQEGDKLSAALLDFVEPFRKDAPTDEAFKKLIALAVIAWNATILPEDKRKELIDATINGIVTMAGEEWRKDAENSMAMLIKHKERYFADDKRLIVDYRLTETNKEYRLAVASFVPVEK
jgi:hypothetical protein